MNILDNTRKNQILSSFQVKEVEKAGGYTEGIYSDTPSNRKLGRVGMSYKQYIDKLAGKTPEKNQNLESNQKDVKTENDNDHIDYKGAKIPSEQKIKSQLGEAISNFSKNKEENQELQIGDLKFKLSRSADYRDENKTNLTIHVKVDSPSLQGKNGAFMSFDDIDNLDQNKLNNIVQTSHDMGIGRIDEMHQANKEEEKRQSISINRLKKNNVAEKLKVEGNADDFYKAITELKNPGYGHTKYDNYNDINRLYPDMEVTKTVMGKSESGKPTVTSYFNWTSTKGEKYKVQANIVVGDSRETVDNGVNTFKIFDSKGKELTPTNKEGKRIPIYFTNGGEHYKSLREVFDKLNGGKQRNAPAKKEPLPQYQIN